MISIVVFAFIGELITLVMFDWGSGSYGDVGKVRLLLGILVLVVLLEEMLMNSVFSVYGLALSIGGLVSVPVLAIKFGREDRWLRTALDAVALVFATRVVLSPFPVGYFKLSIFLPMIYTLILVAVVLYLTFRGLQSREIRLSSGESGVVSQVLMGLSAGAAVGVVEYFVLRPEPILMGEDFLKAFLYTFIVLAVMVGVVEEVLFRGLLQTSLEKVMPVWQAIGVASIMFGLMHVGWMNPLEVLLAYGAGVVFGYLANSMDSLIAPIIAHGSGNLLLYLIPFMLGA